MKRRQPELQDPHSTEGVNSPPEAPGRRARVVRVRARRDIEYRHVGERADIAANLTSCGVPKGQWFDVLTRWQSCRLPCLDVDRYMLISLLGNGLGKQQTANSSSTGSMRTAAAANDAIAVELRITQVQREVQRCIDLPPL